MEKLGSEILHIDKAERESKIKKTRENRGKNKGTNPEKTHSTIKISNTTPEKSAIFHMMY